MKRTKTYLPKVIDNRIQIQVSLRIRMYRLRRQQYPFKLLPIRLLDIFRVRLQLFLKHLYVVL